MSRVRSEPMGGSASQDLDVRSASTPNVAAGPRPHARAGAFIAACALVAVSSVVVIGCEDDASLWGDAMSPTQMQRADQGPSPVGNMFTTSGGDSEDPFVDNASYPFVQGPWWSNPAYNGG